MKTIQFQNTHDNLTLTWASDLHFDEAEDAAIKSFTEEVRQTSPAALLLTGDIGSADNYLEHLKNLHSKLKIPIYFVLGNHDYHGSSISKVRANIPSIPNLYYLQVHPPIALTQEVALIGVDGWADGQCGNFIKSPVRPADFDSIEEFQGETKKELQELLKQLGQEAAELLLHNLEKALKTHSKILILTHVPPFEQACRRKGVLVDQDLSPHFVCKQTGAALKSLLSKHPNQEATVLCGHSHSESDVQILPNLRVVTAGSTTGSPHPQGVVIL